MKRLGAPRIPVGYAPTLEDEARVTRRRRSCATLQSLTRSRHDLRAPRRPPEHTQGERPACADPPSRHIAARRSPRWSLPPSSALAQSAYKAEVQAVDRRRHRRSRWGKGGEIWADLVRERTKGRINIKMYPGASLVDGDQTREFTAIRQGVIDLAVGSTINWSPQIKELNLFSLPFLMPRTTRASTR